MAFPVRAKCRVRQYCLSHCSAIEEFGIYLNYVRKLGFEETPDYDFLRELFSKVMKNNNDVDDGVYDWNLLNGVCHNDLSNKWLISRSDKVARVGRLLL